MKYHFRQIRHEIFYLDANGNLATPTGEEKLLNMFHPKFTIVGVTHISPIISVKRIKDLPDVDYSKYDIYQKLDLVVSKNSLTFVS